MGRSYFRAHRSSLEMVQIICDAVSAGCMVFVPEWFDIKLGLLKWTQEKPIDFNNAVKYYKSVPWDKICNYIIDEWGLNIFNRRIIDFLKNHNVQINELEPYEMGMVVDRVFKSGATQDTEKS